MSDLAEPLHIAVGVIRNENNDVLIAQRPSDLHQGGLWEFPGGKVEAGESVYEALARELLEELNLHVELARPLLRVRHTYPEYPVLLDVWQIDGWYGDVYGREGQPIEWRAVRHLRERDFPSANQAIIRALELPPLYLISPPVGNNYADFLARAEYCLRAGVRLLQLRSVPDASDAYRQLVMTLKARCDEYGARLLLNARAGEFLATLTHGLHLPAARLLQLNTRPLGDDYLVAASCHNRMEVEHAVRLGLDFIVLSPVQATQSHPGTETLGWEGLHYLTEYASMPAYALGGMQPEDMTTAQSAGAQGIAMLSGVWQAPDPAGVIRACMNSE